PDDETADFILAPVKSNLGPPAQSLKYQIVAAGIASRVEWRGASEHQAEALLADNGTPEDRSALDDAIHFLREELADGPIDAKEIRTRATSAGIAIKTRERAKGRLRVRSLRAEFKGGWRWHLPSTIAQDRQYPGLAALADADPETHSNINAPAQDRQDRHPPRSPSTLAVLANGVDSGPLGDDEVPL